MRKGQPLARQGIRRNAGGELRKSARTKVLTQPATDVNVVLWNTGWANPDRAAGKYVRGFTASKSPAIVCYPEVCDGMFPESGQVIRSEADYGYANTEGRRKVALWSSEPWSDVDDLGSKAIPGGRFVSGVSHGIRFVGVCIPWRDAHVRTGRKDRRAWEDHVAYLNGLKPILAAYHKNPEPICLIGDFNQRIPRRSQPEKVYSLLKGILEDRFETITKGILDPDGKPLIDHVAVTSGLKASIEMIHPKESPDGLVVSDHVGIVAGIEIVNSAAAETKPETVAQRIYWAYANLAMAHAAVDDGASRYGSKHYAIRARLFKGLQNGTMNIRSLFQDEKEKMANSSCCYCGAVEKLSVDHLLSRNKGGKDSGDNLILACRTCNSSKGKRDLLDWYFSKDSFPPLAVLRRYLKNLHRFCRENDLLELMLSNQVILNSAYSIIQLPTKYPQPSELCFHPKKGN